MDQGRIRERVTEGLEATGAGESAWVSSNQFQRRCLVLHGVMAAPDRRMSSRLA